ncbi:MAG: hypothetical protein EXR72_17275 [Myxococcales bacterium]|nr:hypothetical protein [Myxococcales bacterium]
MRLRALLFASLFGLGLAAPNAAFAATDPVADLAAEVSRADAARGEVEARRATLEQRSQEEAREIERQKAQPAGVARDYRLGQLLATAQDRASELDQLAADLRSRDESLAPLRTKLVAACDRALEDPALPDLRRADLVRRRAAESARLAAAASQADLEIARPSLDPLDGPSELAEKADLLKDSEDKLRREVLRLGRRIEGVEGRRRLRERAGAVDDDLFGESSTGRRVVRVAPVTQGAAADAARGGTAFEAEQPKASPAPQAGGAPGTNGPPSDAGKNNLDASVPRLGVSMRGMIDPATLDDLHRAEAGQDLDAQLRALRRVQGNLKGLADDLGRRESDLRRRAREIKPRK